MFSAAYIEIPLRQSKSTTKFGFTFQKNVIIEDRVIEGEYFYQDTNIGQFENTMQ
jgi:hypothetical protein